MKRLTRDDIVEVVGEVELSSLKELEILFLQCDELGSLHHCSSLSRLAVIDTGLKRLSNLAPLGPSLVSLCVCDQDIKKIENLLLPNLKELFLHRNQITQIEGLEHCPRLRRLWLFQNEIVNISGLQALPELEECWLQGNRIASLLGIESSGTLMSLALGGNMISDYSELHRLQGLGNLTSLALQDVHFGRCPIVDDSGYRNFCVCYMPQISFLDGIQLSSDHQKLACLSHLTEVSTYNDRIAMVESIIKTEIDGVDAKQQVRCLQLCFLCLSDLVREGEQVPPGSAGARDDRGNAVNLLFIFNRFVCDLFIDSELEGLVSEGRASMAKQMKKQKKLMENSFKVLEKNIAQEKSKANAALNSALASLGSEHDISEALFCVLERVTTSEIGLLDLFSRYSKPQVGQNETAFTFQVISDNAPDFVRMASILPLNHQCSSIPSAVLLKLYRTGKYSKGALVTPIASNESKTVPVECYSVLSLDQLQTLISAGLHRDADSIHSRNDSISSLVFCTDIGVAISLFSSSCGSAEKACFGEHEISSTPSSLDKDADPVHSCTDNMPAFKSARNSKLLLTISCVLDLAVLDLSVKTAHRIRLPASTSARQEMYADLRKAKKPVAFEIDVPIAKEQPPALSHIFIIPEDLCRQEFVGPSKGRENCSIFPLNVNFVGICVTPILDGIVGIGGMRAMESKLEMIFSPVRDIAGHGSPIQHGSPSHRIQGIQGNDASDIRRDLLSNAAIQNFNAAISAEIRDYLDRTLEEVTAETAETLIAADMDVENRSAAIRALRSQIEEERKAQEALLKKMKIADDRGGNGHSTHQGNATNTSRSAGATQRDRRR